MDDQGYHRRLTLLTALHKLLVGLLLAGVAVTAYHFLTTPPLPDPQQLSARDLLLWRIAGHLLPWTFFALLVTGVIYGLFTHHGFVRNKWVALKWVGVVALYAVYTNYLGPGVGGMAALSDSGLASGDRASDYAAYASVARSATWAMLGGLLLLTVLSVVKPFGAFHHLPLIPRRPLRIGIGVVLAVFVVLWIVNTAQLRRVRSQPVANVDISALSDGTYRGTVESFGRYTVEVVVLNGELAGATILEGREDNRYDRLAAGVFSKMARRQRVDVDAVTAATTTSRTLQKAVEAALTGPPEAPVR